MKETSLDYVLVYCAICGKPRWVKQATVLRIKNRITHCYSCRGRIAHEKKKQLESADADLPKEHLFKTPCGIYIMAASSGRCKNFYTCDSVDPCLSEANRRKWKGFTECQRAKK